MKFIKNYKQLATNDQRRVVLDLIETAFAAITPQEIFKNNFSLDNKLLKIQNRTFDLTNFNRVILLGFGKGSALMCKILEEKLGELLTEGYDIDVVEQAFSKIQATLGTHPLPSQQNFDFTKHVIEKLSNLTEKDFVIITTCGGGSVMFESPHKLTLEQITGMNKALLNSGATISEMNTIRKHLSRVKGGSLAKILYPATVVNLLFSDVPGNDLSVIASGPLVKDPTTIQDATKIYEKYDLKAANVFTPSDFVETPKEDKYFEHVHNILFLSNHTALSAMEKRARELGYEAIVLTDRLQGDSRTMGEQLIKETPPDHILLAGGETTIKITGHGKGGRNQALVVSALDFLKKQLSTFPLLTGEGQGEVKHTNIVLASFDSDGWDFYGFAGALADRDTLKKMADMHLDPKPFLADDNSYEFLQKIGDGIDTGKLESNVSDLFIVLKK